MARPIPTAPQGFAVSGRLPGSVSGRLLGIRGGVLHSVQIRHGEDASYLSHRIRQSGSAGSADRELTVFGGSIVELGHGSLAQQLSPDLVSSAPVDLDGQFRRLAARPRRDPVRIGNRTVNTHELASGRHVNRSFDDGQPFDLVFVDDRTRPRDVDGGWLVGSVHDASDGSTGLVLLDAADIAGQAVVAARIPGLVPPDPRTTWIATTSRQPHQGDRS